MIHPKTSQAKLSTAFSTAVIAQKGRLAEDGAIPSCYLLQETSTRAYPQRTEFNVRDSDGTDIFTIKSWLNGGSLKTAAFAQKLGKPCFQNGLARLARGRAAAVY